MTISKFTFDLISLPIELAMAKLNMVKLLSLILFRCIFIFHPNLVTSPCILFQVQLHKFNKVIKFWGHSTLHSSQRQEQEHISIENTCVILMNFGKTAINIDLYKYQSWRYHAEIWLKLWPGAIWHHRSRSSLTHKMDFSLISTKPLHIIEEARRSTGIWLMSAKIYRN